MDIASDLDTGLLGACMDDLAITNVDCNVSTVTNNVTRLHI